MKILLIMLLSQIFSYTLSTLIMYLLHYSPIEVRSETAMEYWLIGWIGATTFYKMVEDL